MKKLIVISLLLVSISLQSQTLNKLGKIKINEIPQEPEYTIEKFEGKYRIKKDSFVFEGNTFFELPNGFLTGLIVFDDEEDWLKHFNKKGEISATIKAAKIINLKVTENGNKAVFYNEDNLFLIDLISYNIDTLDASFVYEFIHGNELIYYQKKNKQVVYKGKAISIDEFPSQFMVYNNKILAISKSSIFELKSPGFESIYHFKGQFFDAQIIGNEFYFVEKRTKRNKESFSLYKTTNFSKKLLMDKLDDLNQ